MHEKDRALIQSIQDFFGGIGYVSKPNNTSTVEFRVTTIKDIVDVIIPHFDNYPLITQKYSDFVLFKQIVLLMLNKEHNTYDGVLKIVNIKASLNLGLSNDLKKAFPNAVPVSRLDYLYKGIIEPSWLAGFATGESNFFITLQKSNTKSGLAVSLRFSISQHSRDFLLLKNLINEYNSLHELLEHNGNLLEEAGLLNDSESNSSESNSSESNSSESNSSNES